MGKLQSIAMVAEEQDFYSAGLAAVLKRQVGYGSVLRAKNLAELTDLLTANAPVDLLAVASDLPGSHGAETIRSLRAQYPDMRIAVFSHCTDANILLNMLSAGAHGVISKQTADCEELLRALRTISEAGVFVPPVRVANGSKPDERAWEASALTGLTERQRQVIRLLSEGYPNKVIARELGISPSTVKVHVHAAFRTLGVHSRMAAVAVLRPMAYEAGSRY